MHDIRLSLLLIETPLDPGQSSNIAGGKTLFLAHRQIAAKLTRQIRIRIYKRGCVAASPKDPTRQH